MKAFIKVNWTAESYSGVEFPPAPTRFLQAIIAGSQGNPEHFPVLKHLEAKLPVVYGTTDPAEVHFGTYVINNDENLEHNNAASQKQHVIRRADNLRVVYEYDIADDMFPALQKAVSDIHTLGRAGDFIVAHASASADLAQLDRYEVRSGGSIRLNAPVAGFIDSVFARYNTGSVLRLKQVSYAKNPRSPRDYALFTLTEPVPSESASHVVSWIRHAGMKRIPDLSGHGDHSKRLAIIPVATLDYSDNMIRRVIIAAPDSVTARKATAKLAGLHLTADDGTDKGYLVPAEHDKVFADYLSASRRWRSVTPVISGFDNGDPRQRMRNMVKQFAQAGLPTPQRVTFVPHRTDQFFAAKYLEDRPRFSVEVEFAEPVTGIVAAGAGRYAGLGIFASQG